MVGLLSRNDGSVGDQREMNPRIRNQICLELIQVNIQGSVKPQRSCDGGYNLADESVQVGVGRPLNIQVPSADVIDSLVVNHESTVRMFEGGVSAEGRIVRLDYSCGNLKKILKL